MSKRNKTLMLNEDYTSTKIGNIFLDYLKACETFTMIFNMFFTLSYLLNKVLTGLKGSHTSFLFAFIKPFIPVI